MTSLDFFPTSTNGFTYEPGSTDPLDVNSESKLTFQSVIMDPSY